MARPRKLPQTLEGNLTIEQQTRLELEQQIISTGTEQLEKPPRWLRDSTAKKEWKRLVDEFKKLEVISNLDLNNLGAYCNAYSSYIQVTKVLKGKNLTVSYTNKHGATNTVENPLLKIQMKYSDEMRKYSSLLGLSIDSRLKIATLQIERAKNKIDQEFGDI